MKTLLRMSLCTLCTLWLNPLCHAAITISNSTGPSNITTTAATLWDAVTATNNIPWTNVIAYGTVDGTNLLTSWQFALTNTAPTFGQNSTNLTGLTPATRYYYRAFAYDTNGTANAGSTTNWTTLAGAPSTGMAAIVSVPLTVNTNGTVTAPANFLPANTIVTNAGLLTSQTALSNTLLAAIAAAGTALSNTLLASTALSNTLVTGWAASDTALSNTLRSAMILRTMSEASTLTAITDANGLFSAYGSTITNALAAMAQPASNLLWHITVASVASNSATFYATTNDYPVVTATNTAHFFLWGN